MSEREPTVREHRILEEINPMFGNNIENDDKNIELYWELVRNGYLKNLVSLRYSGWIFRLTDKADMYLTSVNST